MNQVLNLFCQVYFANSSHIEIQHGTVKNCFGTIKHYLTRDIEKTDRDFAMSNCCYQCFRNIIFHFLPDDFYFV